MILCPSGYDPSSSELPSGRLLPRLLLETFAFLLLLGAKLLLVVDAQFESFDMLLEHVAIMGVHHAQRLYTRIQHNLSCHCQPVTTVAGRRHLRSADSRCLVVLRTQTVLGTCNFVVAGTRVWGTVSQLTFDLRPFQQTFAVRIDIFALTAMITTEDNIRASEY